ncbi:MAG TPA: DUF72 domain-containing protein [Longimicrobiales bacterium]|nr:DUF72 domain-containing protein [Longimicrobiales bacterium]
MPATEGNARRYRIGTQGWNYDFWSGVFYPPGTKSLDRLELYSRIFDTVEVDSTFYATPPPGRFRSWYERTPDEFLFTAKLPRSITHDARLVGAASELFEFCDRAAELEEKLGPLLIQLPPDMGVGERDAVEGFLGVLPAELAFAIEFRQVAWFTEDIFDLVRRWDVAMAVSVGPWMDSATAQRVARVAPGSFQYLRWMGSPRRQQLTPSLIREREQEVAAWAATILSVNAPATYAYFNNDYLGSSPDSARRLQTLLGLEPRDMGLMREQQDLFG